MTFDKLSPVLSEIPGGQELVVCAILALPWGDQQGTSQQRPQENLLLPRAPPQKKLRPPRGDG